MQTITLAKRTVQEAIKCSACYCNATLLLPDVSQECCACYTPCYFRRQPKIRRKKILITTNLQPVL